MNKIFVNKMDLLRYDIEISYKNKLERQRKCERLIMIETVSSFV